MYNKHLTGSSRLLAALFLSTFLLPGQAVSLEPNRLEVQLLNRQTGQPVADAAVCLGTSARQDQFGARRSDADGRVRFEDVSPYPLVLTVSGRGYQGARQAIEPLHDSRVLVVKLATGGGGPVCAAPRAAQAAPAASSVSIDAVRVRLDRNNPQGVLVATWVSGPVNEIRVSERADFSGADWQPYQSAVPFALSAEPGAKRLYIQVRRVAQVQGASIEVVSPVRQAAYRKP